MAVGMNRSDGADAARMRVLVDVSAPHRHRRHDSVEYTWRLVCCSVRHGTPEQFESLAPCSTSHGLNSFNRVGNAPRGERRGQLFCHTTRGALPTRLNDRASISADGTGSLCRFSTVPCNPQ